MNTQSTRKPSPAGSGVRFNQASPPRPPGEKRILVVDNEPASTRLARLTLEKHTPFQVREINDPSHAVASALQFRPDLILLDIEMPGMDGGTLAEHMHADTTLRCVPIVFVTSLVTEDEAAQPMLTGGSRVLAKPVTASKLIRCVAELLGMIGGLSPGAATMGARRGQVAERIS